jgi:nicotinamidase-related amidase
MEIEKMDKVNLTQKEGERMSNNIALLIIDVQNGLFSISEAPIYNGKSLISNIVELINKARRLEIPIIYVQHCSESGGLLEPNTEGWNICSDISPIQGDLIIEKRTPDSFHDTVLKEALESRGIKRLVVAGLQTEFCIDTTCRRAFSLGYEVTLVEDGHSTMDSKVLNAENIIKHHNSILGSWFCELKPTKDIEFKR